MKALYIGSSGSGKSKLAELALQDYAAQHHLGASSLDAYYLATMQATDDPEVQAKIHRHRKQRAGLKLQTIEVPQLDQLDCFLQTIDRFPDQPRIGILDCLGNLYANVCFAHPVADCTASDFLNWADAVVQRLLALHRSFSALWLVSNQIFEDLPVSKTPVEERPLLTWYQMGLGMIHRSLAAYFEIYQVVYDQLEGWRHVF